MSGRAAASEILDGLVDLIADRVVAKIGAPAAKPEGKLISIKDAAERMGVTEKALRHQINAKDFPARAVRRFGRRILIERALFDQWLAAH